MHCCRMLEYFVLVTGQERTRLCAIESLGRIGYYTDGCHGIHRVVNGIVDRWKKVEETIWFLFQITLFHHFIGGTCDIENNNDRKSLVFWALKPIKWSQNQTYRMNRRWRRLSIAYWNHLSVISKRLRQTDRCNSAPKNQWWDTSNELIRIAAAIRFD